MTQDGHGLAIAVVCEPDGGTEGRIAAGLSDLGWEVQAIDCAARKLSDADAQLWAVDLEELEPDPWPFLHSLYHLDAWIPLLLVARRHQVNAHIRELTNLIGEWPAGLEVMIWPYPPEELRLRVSALTARRTRFRNPGPVYELGALQLDVSKHTARFSGNVLDLTPTEFEILHALVDRDGRVLSRSSLLTLLRGDNHHYDDRVMAVHISRFRAKLRAAGVNPKVISTVPRVGYRLEAAYLERL